MVAEKHSTYRSDSWNKPDPERTSGRFQEAGKAGGEQAGVDKRSQWQFLMTDQHEWKWVVVSSDGTRSESAEAFATLAACTSNAAQHGYVAWKSEDERRRELQLGVTGALKRK